MWLWTLHFWAVSTGNWFPVFWNFCGSVVEDSALLDCVNRYLVPSVFNKCHELIIVTVCHIPAEWSSRLMNYIHYFLTIRYFPAINFYYYTSSCSCCCCCSSSIGTTAQCGLWPVEQYPSIFPYLSPTLSIYSLPALEDLFLLPLSILSSSILSRWPNQLIICPFILLYLLIPK